MDLPRLYPGMGKGEGTLQCHLFWELSFHLLLEAPEQEGPEHLVQAADNEDCLLLVQIHLAREGNCHQKQELSSEMELDGSPTSKTTSP